MPNLTRSSLIQVRRPAHNREDAGANPASAPTPVLHDEAYFQERFRILAAQHGPIAAFYRVFGEAVIEGHLEGGARTSPFLLELEDAPDA